MPHSLFNRRDFSLTIAATAATAATATVPTRAQGEKDFSLKYIVGSSLYGYTPLKKLLPEVRKTAAAHIDIWPKSHGNQREQVAEMGEDTFSALLAASDISLGCITQYKLGPFGLQEEMKFAQRFGCQTIVSGAVGPQKLVGSELKSAVKNFIEQMKPHVAVAEETGVTIAIENHGNSLIRSPDSMKWLIEERTSEHLAIALAPYHLPQDEELLSHLIRDLGNGIEMFYAWQYGMGCHKKLPKEQELLQLPGRGELNFEPLLAALRDIHFHGWTEIFMHPVPRGIPILEPTSAVTGEINRARKHIAEILYRI